MDNRYQPHSIRRHHSARVFLFLVFLLTSSFLPAPTASASSYFLSATNIILGPANATNSLALTATPSTAAWTAGADVSWLHLGVAYLSGIGSTNLIYSCDANLGLTRTGTLTIAGQKLTVIQAGAAYIPAGLVPLVSSGLSAPYGTAVDNSGNVYIADSGNNALKVWSPSSNTVTTLLSTGLSTPYGVALDGVGNLYIADSGNNAIKMWSSVSNTVTTLVSSGLNRPYGLAVDGVGNVYIADSLNNGVKMWSATTHSVISLLPSGSLRSLSISLDQAGNVYLGDILNNAIKMWSAASSNVITLVSKGISHPFGVAPNQSGDVYFTDSSNNAIKKLSGVNTNVVTLFSSAVNIYAFGTTLDSAGNVYFSDYRDNVLYELPNAFVLSSTEVGYNAGIYSIPIVIPATANVGVAPMTSDQTWLTVSGVTNGILSVSLQANPSFFPRTVHVGILGQKILITQLGVPYALGETTVLEGPQSGMDSVVLAVASPQGSWVAAANSPWLHISSAYQSGVGGTNVVFGYDANTGATRTGSITVAGLLLSVTQAGSAYVAAAPRFISAPGISNSIPVAVDTVGNVYIADFNYNTIKEWLVASNTVITLVSSGLYSPRGLAVDGSGNVFISDSANNAIKEWTASNGNVISLITSNLFVPYGMALDGGGNVYFADGGNSAIKVMSPDGSRVKTLVSTDIYHPLDVAVDAAGNVYIAQSPSLTIKVWQASSSNVTTLSLPDFNSTVGICVDGGGNVYMSDTYSGSVKKLSAVDGTLTTFFDGDILAPGYTSAQPVGVAIDSQRNVYIADLDSYSISEVLYAFVNPTGKLVDHGGGAGALPTVLPPSLNLLSPFAPVSDQPWLTITGVTNGIVSYGYTANTGGVRTAHISLLGQLIPITQAAVGSQPIIANVHSSADGTIQISFTNNPGAPFSILASTNLSLPLSNWTVIGTPTNIYSNAFRFTIQASVSNSAQYFAVRSP